MKTESYKKTTLVSYPIFATAQLCNFIFYIVFFKSFPLQEIGVFSSTIAILSFFVLLLDLGFLNILTREFAKKTISMKRSIQLSFGIKGSIIIVAFLLLNFTYRVLGFSNYKYLLFIIIGISLSIDSFSNIFISWLTSNNRQIAKNGIIGVISLIKLLSLFLLLGIGKNTAMAVSWILVTTSVFQLILCLAMVNRTEKDHVDSIDDKFSISQILRLALPFLFIGLFATFQNRFDWILIENFTSQIELAKYAAANRLYEQFILFVGFAITTSYPWMCRNLEEEKFKLNVYHKFIIWGSAILAFSLAMASPQVFKLFWGDKFKDAEPIAIILFLTAGFSTLVAIMFYKLLSLRKEKSIIPVVLCASVFQLVLNLLLIPRFGGLGAAVGMSGMIGATLAGFSLLLLKTKSIETSMVYRPIFYLAALLSISFLLIVFDIVVAGKIAVITGASLLFGKNILLNNSEEREWAMMRAKELQLKFMKK